MPRGRRRVIPLPSTPAPAPAVNGMRVIVLEDEVKRRLKPRAERLLALVASRDQLMTELQRVSEAITETRGRLQGAVAEHLEVQHGFDAAVAEGAGINVQRDGSIEVTVPQAAPNRAARRAARKNKVADAAG